MEIKSVDKKGLEFIGSQEGCILHPYRDSVGIWTIGIGCTYYEDGTRVKATDAPISSTRAVQLFKNVLKHYEDTVWSVTRDDINQNQFNALVSICYNIGVNGFKSSTLLKRVNNDPTNYKGIEAAFLMWRWAGKKPLLLGRRRREVEMFFS